MNIDLHHGDCLEVMRGMADSSVDAVVTDPPAAISFMNKEWDGDMGGRAVWVGWLSSVMAECLRVLKPGGHAFVWALPRTSHWTACAIEDAGFEIRDVVTHHFGSGFPKSHDVSKAIDRMLVCPLCQGAKVIRVSDGEEGWEEECPKCNGSGRALEGREVVGKYRYPDGSGDRRVIDSSDSANTYGSNRPGGSVDVTSPATPEAAQWEGWGTALKPGGETWLLCAKPLDILGYCAIINQNLSILEAELCKHVAPNVVMSSEPTLLHSSETRGNTVQEPALTSEKDYQENVTPIGEAGDTNSRADTSGSISAAVNIALNTLSSWKSILGDLCSQESKFTTEMASGLTTDLKTLNSLLSQITPDSMHQGAFNPSGLLSTVDIVDSLLSASLLRLDAIQMLSAIGNATSGATSPTKQASDLHALDTATRKGILSEHWILARKPLQGTVAANVLAWGTGALNVDGGRVSIQDVHNGFRSGNYTSRNDSRTSWEHRENGEGYRKDQHPQGRWPANVLLSHSAECRQVGVKRVRGTAPPGRPSQGKPRNTNINFVSNIGGGQSYSDPNGLETVEAWECSEGCPVAELDRQSGERITGNSVTRSVSTFQAQHDGRKGTAYLDTGGASRYFQTFEPEYDAPFLYCAKSSRRERGQDNHHCTVKPIKLMRYLCRLITPPNGTVLDPFMGSGSTGVAAIEESFDFIGCEREAEYLAIAEKRIQEAQNAARQMEFAS